MEFETTDELEMRPKIHGVNIVTVFSPAKFTVVYSERPLHLLKELELDIAKTWDEETQGFSRDKNIIPTAGMFVAYRDEVSGCCKRGFIQSIMGDSAEIFLCDYGTFTTVDVFTKCIPLGEFHRLSLGFYASIVIIPGFIPTIPLKLSNGIKLIPATSWSKEAIGAGQAWLEEGTRVGITRFGIASPISITGDLYKENSKYSFSQFMEEQKMTNE